VKHFGVYCVILYHFVCVIDVCFIFHAFVRIKLMMMMIYILCDPHATFGHNSDQCKPILKILSLTDSIGNFKYKDYKIFSHLQCVSTPPCES